MADERREMQRRRLLERLTAIALLLASILVIGGVGVILYSGAIAWVGMIAMGISVFLLAGAQAASYGVDQFRFVSRRSRGNERVEHLSRWNKIKTSSALHNLLTVLGAILLLMGLIGRMGLIELNLTGRQADRAIALFLVLYAFNSAYAHWQSLHVSLDPDRTAATRILFWAGLQLGVLIGAFALYIGILDAELAVGAVTLGSTDSAMLIVAALTVSGAMLQISRGLPSIFAILSDPRTAVRGGYASKTKSVLMPTMVAFTLLLVFVLLIVIFGAGIFSVLETVNESGSVVAVLALMVVAVLVGVGISFYLARQEDKVELFKEVQSHEQKMATGIIAASATVGGILLIMAVMVNKGTAVFGMHGDAWMHLASFGMIVALAPYGVYAGRRRHRIKNMEARFPDFLRDLASSHKGGLTLVQSVQIASRGEYGDLSSEIQRLADQLSWNVSFEEAFGHFADRVNTPLLRRSVNLVLEAGRSGGSTTDVLLAAARDAREIKTLERERNLNMSVYTTVIYVTFFVFLFVVGVLVGQFLPEIIRAGEATANSDLDMGDGGLNLGGVGEDDYRQFYFIAASVQAIGNGMLAGIMGSGNASTGLRHAAIMVLCTYIGFGFVL